MTLIEKPPAIPDARPLGHGTAAALAIGALSVILAAGLELLGMLDAINAGVSKSLGAGTDFPKQLPMWAIWLAVVFFAFGTSFALLGSPSTWRRILLWLSAMAVVAGWAPALALAAHSPEIAVVLVATIWSGVCALVYAGRHRMASDEPPELRTDEAR